MRLWIGAILLLTTSAGPVWAQHVGGDREKGFSELARAPIRAGGPYLSTLRDLSGDPILVINYPWSSHKGVSVEVAMLPAAQIAEVRPVYFYVNGFKGENLVTLSDSQDNSAESPVRAKIEVAGTDYEVLGRRNALGKPSVVAAAKTPVEEIAQVVNRAVFCLLDAWAMNPRLLQLELPEAYFAPAGKIRVWLLRGDTVLWSEDIAWPGFSQ